jgi:ferredoxin-NADP reductase
MRACSIASPNDEEHLEFFSIKVQDGPLTSRLQYLRPGDDVPVSRKPTGTLVLRDLRPGKRLYLLATGTGLAPFLSIIRDLQVYEHFERVVPSSRHARCAPVRLCARTSFALRLPSPRQPLRRVQPELPRTYACQYRTR